MTPIEAAERLRLAELEIESAHYDDDGSLRAAERCRAALSEHFLAWAIVQCLSTATG